MSGDNEDISAFYRTLKAIEEYESFYDYYENKCTFFAVFPNEITLYHYFEGLVDSHDYLNELNEIFEKYGCYKKLCWSPLRIHFFYEHNEKKTF